MPLPVSAIRTAAPGGRRWGGRVLQSCRIGGACEPLHRATRCVLHAITQGVHAGSGDAPPRLQRAGHRHDRPPRVRHDDVRIFQTGRLALEPDQPSPCLSTRLPWHTRCMVVGLAEGASDGRLRPRLGAATGRRRRSGPVADGIARSRSRRRDAGPSAGMWDSHAGPFTLRPTRSPALVRAMTAVRLHAQVFAIRPASDSLNGNLLDGRMRA